MLLDTVSTDYEAASLLEEERAGVSKERGGRGGGRERGTAGSGGREGEGDGGKGNRNKESDKVGGLVEDEGEEERSGEKTHLTSSLPSEVERHIGRGEVTDEFPRMLSARDGQRDGESSTNVSSFLGYQHAWMNEVCGLPCVWCTYHNGVHSCCE